MRKKRFLVALLVIVAALAIVAVFLLFPRNYGKLIRDADSIFFQFVSWEYTDNDSSPNIESEEFRLSLDLDDYDEIYSEIFDIMDDYYFFVCPFLKTQNNHAVWLYIVAGDECVIINQGTNSVNINGVSCKFFGTDDNSAAMVNEIYNVLKSHSLIED